jgi:hypothetical protein
VGGGGFDRGKAWQEVCVECRRMGADIYFPWAPKTFWMCGVRCGVRVGECAAVEEGSSSFLGFI